MNLFSKLIIGFICGIALSHLGWAGETLNGKILQALQSRFPGAKIEILSITSNTEACDSCEIKNFSMIQENGNGKAQFQYQAKSVNSPIITQDVVFNANMPTWIAKRRIRPGEKLSQDDFERNNVDVSKGLAYQYRGMMMKEDASLDGLQARLTILEGQYPLSNGVEKSPNIRKGDIVQVKLTAGEIQLMTQAIAQEPGYQDQNVRVITQKGKKELTGMLKEGGVVEVRL